MFSSGYGWTFIHYESLLPLLAFGHSRRAARVAALGSTVLVCAIAVLYQVFGLTVGLASASIWFQLAMALALAAAALPLLHGWIVHRIWPSLFLIAFAATLGLDKGVTRDQLAASITPHFVAVGREVEPVASGNLVHATATSALREGHGVVLVVFESLGTLVPEDPAAADVAARLNSAGVVWQTIPHEGGSTVPAEIRYLCGVNGALDDGRWCLPSGLRSVALHGNSLSYFERQRLYRQMGFERLLGRNQLPQDRLCNFAYQAVCDDALLKSLQDAVREQRCRGVFYALTIDAHFPYAKYADHVSGLHDDLFRWVEGLRALRREFPDCRLYIAGDHPPPLAPRFSRKSVLFLEIQP